MYKLPERLKKLEPYEPVAGEFPIRLDANESFLSAPDWLRDEIAEAVRATAFHRYPDPLCTKLREGFAAFYGVNPELVTVGNGSDELISLIINTFLGPQDTMGMVRPDFSMYSIYAQQAGVPIAVYEKPGSLEIDVDKLIAFIKAHNVRLLMLSNPCNPTSQAAAMEEMLKIVESLDCLVVVDEAYMDFSEGSILRLTEQYDNLIVLKTCSKVGMAAIRLGFAVANPVLTKVLQAVRSPYNINSMTQAAGCVWFSHGDYIRECMEQIKRSRDSLYNRLASLSARKSERLQIFQSCANFVFIRVADAHGLFKALGKRGVAVRLMGDCLRITAGSETENSCLLNLLEEILR